MRLPIPERDPTSWILQLRPAKAAVNPWKPNGYFLEHERTRSGRIVDSAGILLTNKECPWHCLMCDLWKHTLSHPVPSGAIPAQIDYARQRLGVKFEQIKLYNSGSFFDPAAVPPSDYAAIAQRVSGVNNLIVECHPRLVGDSSLRFQQLLKGSLEVAMGLETVHPRVLPLLNKRFTLEQFAGAAQLLRRSEIHVRAFVLVKPPFLEEGEAIEWAVKSARFAFECGADVVSLIPTRGGNGALEELMRRGQFAPPRLATLERSLEQCLELRAGRVFADTWDLKQFSCCNNCFAQRKQRLESMNLQQSPVARVGCPECGCC